VREYRVAIVGGSGFMGKAHSLALSIAPQLGNGEVAFRKQLLVGSNDVDASESARVLGWKSSSSDWRDAVTREDIEIVDIVTPPHLTADIALAAIEAGKHVFCEKPITNDGVIADRLWTAARASNVVTQVGYNFRHAPAIAYLKQLLLDGSLGDPLQFRAVFLHDLGYVLDDPGWRGNRKTGGPGVSGDIGSHIVDLAEYLYGDVIRVAAQLRARDSITGAWMAEAARHEQDSLDHGGVWIVEFESGAIGTFAVSSVSSGHKTAIRIELDATKGAARFDWSKRDEVEVSFVDDPPQHSGFHSVVVGARHDVDHLWYSVGGLGFGYLDSEVIQFWKFLESVAANTPATPHFGEAAHVQHVIDAVQRSARTSTWEPVPPSRAD
jgi:predicted dehydrogenase